MARAPLFEIDREKQKELFCGAYLDAVVSAAGFTLDFCQKNDDDSVDALIRAKGGPGPRISPRLELQLKSTARPTFNKARTHIRYPLKQKNYNELIGDVHHVPRILAILVLPTNPADWCSHCEDSLTLYRGCYWTSLKALPLQRNRHSTSILIDRSSLFTAQALGAIMLTIAQRQAP